MNTVAARWPEEARRLSLPSRDRTIQWALVVLVVFLIAVPLVPVLFQSFLSAPIYEHVKSLTLANYLHFLASPDFHSAFLNSFVLAFVSTLIGTAAGVFIAIAVARTNMPGRSLVSSVMLLPLYVSQLVLAVGWFIMYGPAGYITAALEQAIGFAPWNFYSLLGMSVLAGIAAAPMTFILCIGSLRLLDASMEDAARSVGANPLRILWSVTLPIIRPALVYSMMLNFISGLELLSIPLIFGRPARMLFFTTFLYSSSGTRTVPDYGLVGAAATFFLLLISILVIIQGLLLRKAARFTAIRGKASRPKPFDLGGWRFVVCALVVAYFVLGLGLPLAGLILRAFVEFLTPLMSPWELLTWSNFATVFHNDVYVRSIINSIVISGFGGALATLVTALITVVIHRSNFRWRRQLEFIALYPRAVPGIIAGLGVLWAVLWIPFLSPLHGTVWILILAFTMRNIPTGYGALSPVLVQIDADLDRSARSVGADWWTTCWRIVLPIAKTGLFSAYVLMFLAFFKEYAAAAFLFAHGSEVIGISMLESWGIGDVGPAAALGVIQFAATCVFIFATQKLLRVRLHA
ncbi:MAG: iron ABC transporter permease [Proteobacteria bacterium]|nr:iron ABC transporter permease [Pseudomonadota bacterium]